MRTRRPPFQTYSPPRRDSRVAEARVMLQDRRTLEGLTVNGLRCQWNLKEETAQQLMDEERARRERPDGGAGGAAS